MFLNKRFVDLTMPVEEGMPTFMAAWHPMVSISLMGRHGYEGRETRRVIFGTHTGTHMDAPRHFISGGKTIEQIPLDMCMGEATFLNMSYLSEKHMVSTAELKQALAGRPVDRLIIGFGWDHMVGQLAYFYNHPYLSEDAAQWLVDQGCRQLLLDTPQPDNPLDGRGTPRDGVVHKILLGAEVVLVEYLVNTVAIAADRCMVVAVPLPFTHGDGSPVRCYAIV